MSHINHSKNPSDSGDGSSPAPEQHVFVEIEGLAKPLRLTPKEYEASPWRNMARYPEVTQERLKDLVKEIRSAAGADEEIVAADLSISNREGLIRGLINHLSSLPSDEQKVVLDFVDQSRFPNFENDDLHSLIFLGESWIQAQKISDETLRESVVQILNLEIDGVIFDIFASHESSGADNDPITEIPSSLIDLARHNPDFGEAVRWLCADWKERCQNAFTVETTGGFREDSPDFTPPTSTEIAKEVEILRQHHNLAVVFAGIMEPWDGPSSSWYNPNIETDNLFGREGAVVFLRNAPYETEKGREGLMNLVRSLLKEGEQLKFIIPESCTLASDFYDVRLKAGNTLSSRNIPSLIADYLQSPGNISAHNFLEIPAGPLRDFLRELRALREERPGAIAFSSSEGFQESSTHSFILARGTEPSEEKHVAFMPTDFDTPFPDKPAVSVRTAIFRGTNLCAQKNGTGPYGFCALTSKTLDEINLVAKDHYDASVKGFGPQWGKGDVINYYKPHADLAIMIVDLDENEEEAPESSEVVEDSLVKSSK